VASAARAMCKTNRNDASQPHAPRLLLRAGHASRSARSRGPRCLAAHRPAQCCARVGHACVS
jgi:hypothetical protein